MSELDGQLRAQGGACEHLAKLFAYKRGMTEGGFPCPPLSTTPWADALKQLFVRIAEMKAEREALRCCGNCRHSEYDGSWFGCDLNPVDDEGNDDMNPATERCPLSPGQWEPREGDTA